MKIEINVTAKTVQITENGTIEELKEVIASIPDGYTLIANTVYLPFESTINPVWPPYNPHPFYGDFYQVMCNGTTNSHANIATFTTYLFLANPIVNN